MKDALEVCVDSLESAISAEQGGATRLELCENLVIGGTTPSTAFYRQVRQAVKIPIHVLVRPRFGDFLYSQAEVKRMEEEIRSLAALGVGCFVIGVLTPSGELDIKALKRLMEAAPKSKFALHRAFDMTEDLEKSLEVAIELGISTILTSGGEASAEKGAAVIRQLLEIASGRLEIMPGAGITSANILAIKEKTGASAFHMSGKKSCPSEMIYRNERVFMGLPGISEYEKYFTDAEEIRSAVQKLANDKRN